MPFFVKQWIEIVARHMPVLTKPQATVLALWSLGMALTRSCGLTTVADQIASLLGKKKDAVRQRLREWYWDARDKKGHKRREIDCAPCFPWLLRWILELWPATERQIALAMDATTLGDIFVVLAISVLYRGCGIPIAWVVLPANQPGSHKAHWLALFSYLQGVIPSDWTVIVLADQGLYAPWLFQHIVRLGWHPFLRINRQGYYRREGSRRWLPLAQVVSQPGDLWCERVVCFKTRPLPCTLLAWWGEGYSEPWLVVTDLCPKKARAQWYRMRAWIEFGFRQIKRGGWQWQNSRITDPARATRFWLAVAVATLWVLSVGGEADALEPTSHLEALPENHIARRKASRRSRPRILSCLHRGFNRILTAFLKGLSLPIGRFYPEPWPAPP